ncbi:hypothetical protein [Fluviicola sp.]|uniref:hypothetical protein n=1 Tax=Fluviicola sp. TaxID=1917219 RepID=UPI0031D6E783
MSKTANYNQRFQDVGFTVKSVKGKKLEQLIGAEDPDNPERGPVSIFLKLENANWSEYYFDVCFGTWGDYETKKWEEVEIHEEDYSYHDYAEKFGVKSLIVKSAYCKDNEITLEFENNEKLVFRYKNPDDWDSDYEMVKLP